MCSISLSLSLLSLSIGRPTVQGVPAVMRKVRKTQLDQFQSARTFTRAVPSLGAETNAKVAVGAKLFLIR